MQNLIYCWVDFSKLPQTWAKIGSNLRRYWKMGWFCSKLGPKLDRLIYEWVTFSWKIGICTGLLSNSVAAHPHQNQTWVPPLGLLCYTVLTAQWFPDCIEAFNLAIEIVLFRFLQYEIYRKGKIVMTLIFFFFSSRDHWRDLMALENVGLFGSLLVEFIFADRIQMLYIPELDLQHELEVTEYHVNHVQAKK